MKKRERQLIDGKWFTKPKRGKARLLEYCGNTLTESEFIGLFISALRELTLRWPPRSEAWYKVRKSCPDGRVKFKGQCISCQEWFAEKEIEMDHIEPVGSIRESIKQFATRVCPEIDGWQCLCKSCHKDKTHNKE